MSILRSFSKAGSKPMQREANKKNRLTRFNCDYWIVIEGLRTQVTQVKQAKKINCSWLGESNPRRKVFYRKAKLLRKQRSIRRSFSPKIRRWFHCRAVKLIRFHTQQIWVGFLDFHLINIRPLYAPLSVFCIVIARFHILCDKLVK